MDRKKAVHARQHISRTRPRLSVLVLMAVVVLLALAGVAAARYMLQQQEEGLATATDFYFTSDYLREESESASYYIDPQTKQLDITLSNAADAKRVTVGEIAYNVEALGAQVTNNGGGTLAGGSEKTTKLTVSPNEGVSSGSSFTVTATSTSPYTKTLTATFVLAKGNSYQVEDAVGNTAAVLSITCTDSGGPVTVTLPTGVVPDTTDSRVTSTNDGFTFVASDSGVYSIVLLKSNAAVTLAREVTSFGSTINLQPASQ